MADQENWNQDENDDLIELTDENGETTLFEHLGTFVFKDVTYLAVSEPIETEDDPEDIEVYLLRVEQDEEGNDVYVPAEDEDSDEAFDYFLNMVDQGDFPDEAPESEI